MTEQQPKTPTTEAGRRLIAWLGTQSAETFADGFTIATAIEAEARADLVAQIEKARTPEPVFADERPNPNGYEGGWHDAIEELIAAIRSAAPESERLCLDDSWDSRYACRLPAGHEEPGPGLTSHEYRPKSMPWIRSAAPVEPTPTYRVIETLQSRDKPPLDVLRRSAAPVEPE